MLIGVRGLCEVSRLAGLFLFNIEKWTLWFSSELVAVRSAQNLGAISDLKHL